jgi:F-type H+-transporting ATPase subunit delta
MKHSKNVRSLKKAAFLLLNILTIITAAYSLSLASDGGAASGSGSMYKDFALKVANILIYVSVVAFFVRKPLKNFLSSRRKNVEDTIKGADDALKKATREQKDSEERLTKISEDIKELTEKMKHEGELEKSAIMERAEKVIQRIKHQTEVAIKREFEIVHRKIREETIEHTINNAEETLQNRFKAKDQNKIADMIADEIEKAGEIKVFLEKPISPALKKKVPLRIDTRKQVTETTMKFIKVLLASDEEGPKNIDDIKRAYENYISDITGTSKAQIYSAADVEEAALKKITESMKKAVGKDIEVEVIKDPSIIGGFITKIGSLVFDASIRTQLENMKESLKNEVV